MITKEIIQNDNIRKIEYPFGWIPQRFVTDGVMKMLNGEEILLYVFLSIVSDREGMSFYGDKKICGLTGMTNGALINARFILVKKGFIAYKKPFYQVLNLPNAPLRVPRACAGVNGDSPQGGVKQGLLLEKVPHACTGVSTGG